jgi:hypothetical protein
MLSQSEKPLIIMTKETDRQQTNRRTNKQKQIHFVNLKLGIRFARSHTYTVVKLQNKRKMGKLMQILLILIHEKSEKERRKRGTKRRERERRGKRGQERCVREIGRRRRRKRDREEGR